MPTRLKRLAIASGLYRPLRYVYDRVISPGRLEDYARNRALLGSIVRPGQLCFDIGANIGDKLAPLIDLGARVVAVEPQPDCVAELRARFGHVDRFTCVPAAISSTAGRSRLFLSSRSTQFASLERGWHDLDDRSIEVETITLDELIDKHGHPWFCKIDIEGHEATALRSLSRPVPYIAFEYHVTPEALPNTLLCIELLSGLGAALFNFSPIEDMQFRLPEWQGHDEFVATIRTLEPTPTQFYGDIYTRFPEAEAGHA